MPREIERKFLVKDNSFTRLSTGVLYRQGYLSAEHERIVRIRVVGDEAYITIKGKMAGLSRLEYEYMIPISHANEMLENLCHKPIIEKYRYKIEFEGHIWEVDEFCGDNKGLVIAEIELKEENQLFEKPIWIGEEVTKDMKYHNSNLMKNPYMNW